MIFSLLITAPPSSRASSAALAFCRAISARADIDCLRLFFLHQGVLTASNQRNTLQVEAWQRVINNLGSEAVCCSASASRLGLADKLGAATNDFADGFTMGGLGLLVDANMQSDRVITFGARS